MMRPGTKSDSRLARPGSGNLNVPPPAGVAFLMFNKKPDIPPNGLILVFGEQGRELAIDELVHALKSNWTDVYEFNGEPASNHSPLVHHGWKRRAYVLRAGELLFGVPRSSLRPNQENMLGMLVQGMRDSQTIVIIGFAGIGSLHPDWREAFLKRSIAEVTLQTQDSLTLDRVRHLKHKPLPFLEKHVPSPHRFPPNRAIVARRARAGASFSSVAVRRLHVHHRL